MARPATYDDATRDALLAAAARLLAEGGPDTVTVRGVSEAVGATTSAVYALFGSKQQLLAAIYREAFAALARELADVPLGSDPVTELFELGMAYRRNALANPTLYLVMFSRDPDDVTVDASDAEAAAATLGRLRDAVARAQHAGTLPGDDPHELTLQLWALVHGLVGLELRGALGGPAVADRVWTGALRAIVAGHRAGHD